MRPNKGSTQRLLDLAFPAIIFYLSLWIYELSNYVVMAISGHGATLVIQGILPVGAIGVGQSASSVVIKPVQVLIATGLVLPLYLGLRRTKMHISLLASACVIAVYLSSFYWELLSLVGPLPLVVHEALFTAISIVALGIFTRADSHLKTLIW